MLPVSRPSIGHEELEAIKEVFATGWLGLGSKVLEFENALKEYLGARNVIAVNTGTSALHIALDAFGISCGDEVIVPSLTFCASIQAITALHAVPVFCEVLPDSLNIDVEDVKRKITSKTKAIMPVHYCGNACDMDQLIAIGKEHGLLIIEDAAHAFGSSYCGKRIGSFGDVTCFSFDPIKNITCGEGGAVVLDNDAVAEDVRRKRILGIDKDTWHRYKNERSWFYEVTMQGYRYHMSNINAAIGLIQIEKLPAFIMKKRKIVKIYNEEFGKLEGISLLNWDINEMAPFSYIVRVLGGRRDQMIEFLKEKGIGTGINYIPNHLQPFFHPYVTESLPVTEKLWTEILTLPLYVDMTDVDFKMVVKGVKDFFKQ